VYGSVRQVVSHVLFGQQARCQIFPLAARLQFGGDHVHAVVNRGEAGATSVHVYSPPLSSMSFYRESADGGYEVDRVDQVFAPGSAA